MDNLVKPDLLLGVLSSANLKNSTEGGSLKPSTKVVNLFINHISLTTF